MRWSFGNPTELDPEDLDREAEPAFRPAPDGAAGDDPEDLAWDTVEARDFGDLVLRRWDVVRVPWQLAVDAWRSGTDRIDAFAERLLQISSTGDRVAPRLAVPTTDVPGSVRSGLEACQKPFQLWNVERVESKAKFELKPEPPLTVGQAAKLSEEQRPPRQLDTSTKALAELSDERDFRLLMERQQQSQRLRLWIQKLPYGKPDDEEPERPAGRVISVEELMQMGGGRDGPTPAPRPAPARGPSMSQPDVASPPPRGRPMGGISMSQPDDDDDSPPPPPPPRPPMGGFSMSQPDDDDAPPPPRPSGGLSLSQPDDD